MSQKLQIIGISGKRGVGKTTAADYIAGNYGFTKVSFANALKDMACDIFPFKPVNLTSKGKERPFGAYEWTPREFLINLGQFLRYYDKDYWVNRVNLQDLSGKIVIDDVRFLNEVEKIKGLGGKILRINRYEHLNIYGKNLDDPSECQLDGYKDFDYIIDDCVNITITDLYKQVDQAMQSLK